MVIVVCSSSITGRTGRFFSKTTHRLPAQVFDGAPSAILCGMIIYSCHKSSPPQPLTDCTPRQAEARTETCFHENFLIH